MKFICPEKGYLINIENINIFYNIPIISGDKVVYPASVELGNILLSKDTNNNYRLFLKIAKDGKGYIECRYGKDKKEIYELETIRRIDTLVDSNGINENIFEFESVDSAELFLHSIESEEGDDFYGYF